MKYLPLALLAMVLLVGLFSLGLLHASAGPLGLTFVVNSIGDNDDVNRGDGICATKTGQCSLLAAIREANAHSGADTIHFNIGSGGYKTIKTVHGYTIEEAVTIDATTQPNCTAPCVILNGQNTSGAGFDISASGVTIKGFVINRFRVFGIGIAPSAGHTLSGATIIGNYIGTDNTGTVAHANYRGILIHGGATNVTIGGTDAGSRNIISGNEFEGITITDTGTNGNLIEGNYIGTDLTGTHALGNGYEGIVIESSASDNTIGGTQPRAGNIIAFNGTLGIEIGDTPTDPAKQDAVLGNLIHDNGSLGIDLGEDHVTANDNSAMDADDGPNKLQNYPKLNSAVSSIQQITGQLTSKANKAFTLEFFSSTSCDSQGHGEGATFLGRTQVTTDSTSKASFTFTATASAFTAGNSITATATDSKNNTSEFGKCKTAS